MRYFYFITICLFILTGCIKRGTKSSQNTDTFKLSEINKSMLVIDVRSAQEYSSGHIDRAINIPETVIENEIENYTKDKSQKILLYCRSGRRSGIALNILTNLGYTNVENIGGYEAVKSRLK